MPKKLANGRLARSESLRVRVHAEEREALSELAESLGVKPSRVVRRLVREAITRGPDFFDDGVAELRTTHRELAAIGRNINQLAKAANSKERVVSKDVKRNLAAAKQQVEKVADLYRDAVLRSRQRSARALVADE